MCHFGTLFEQLLDFGMDVEARRIARELLTDARCLFRGNSSVNSVLGQQPSTLVLIPVGWTLSQHRHLLQLGRLLLRLVNLCRNLLYPLAVVHSKLLGIDFMQWQMIFNTRVTNR